MISLRVPPDQERVIVEVEGRPFGVLVRFRNRYRFFASDCVASNLDRLSFRTPFEAENAIARLLQANAVKGAGEIASG